MRIHWLGHPSGLPKNLVVQLKKLSEMTRHWDKFHLALAINYSGRDEIVRTIGKMAKIFTQKSMENLAWEDAKMYMDSSGMPDIDLLIRTSGEQRLSNFMLLQMAYAELFFTETLWPDFSEETFCHALQFYASRERRFGNITPMGNATSKN
jgi:undecaprenyl diphosphate synthase